MSKTLQNYIVLTKKTCRDSGGVDRASPGHGASLITQCPRDNTQLRHHLNDKTSWFQLGRMPGGWCVRLCLKKTPTATGNESWCEQTGESSR
ncbi:hypothetical protein ATANTOWER_019633 [Ataeniobius toweri]|uniref:Uncharacterized protein n=1 Tax=Ataeniobius toweri TaxID=208326 RepID=A0ABU7ASD5_9TELE|nr:hypothetical protein [Ataeniobius toweri]